MASEAVQRLLAKLPDAKRHSSGWHARCPAHNDGRPSLSITEGSDGRVLVRCHAGCSAEVIVSALGLTLRDLMPVDALTVDNTRGNEPHGKVSSTSTPTRSLTTYPTAREAVAQLERQHGKRSEMRTYRNAEGEAVGVVIRWDMPDGKTIRPVSRKGSSWVIGAMPKPRPLYHLPELARAKRIHIAEGEKAADALRELGLTATTSPHGSKSAGTANWSPLAGKLCVIVPDADDPGERYAADVAGQLARLSPAPTVKRIELPDLPPGGDAVEYIAARRAAGLDDDAIRAELQRLADAAEPIELGRAAPASEWYGPFPVDVLPEPLRSYVAKSTQAIGCDPSYVALPMLSALASMIGNTRRIQLKRGWMEPAIIWTAIVGESGTLKTPAFKLVMQPIRDRQDDALKRHVVQQGEYETKMLRYDKALAAWKRDRKNDDDPPEKPHPPQAVRYVVSDTTVEALAPILKANPRGLLLARDELAGWIGSFDRYVVGKGGADAAHWLSMHNGESIVIDRKTGLQTIYVPSAAVSVTGGVQPGILNRVLGYEHRESGLLARLLLAMPPRMTKRWTEAEIPPATEAAVRKVSDRLLALDPDRDDDGNPRPQIVTLTPTGKRAWIAFYDEHAQEQVDLMGDLAAAWSKLEGYAARLALVVHLARWAAGDPHLREPGAVDETSIAAGVTLSRWFGHEARRVYGILAESDEDRNRRQLVELIQRKRGSITSRELMRASRRFPTAPDAEAALQELAKAGEGYWDQVSPGRKGGKPSKQLVLVHVGRVGNALPTEATDVDDTPVGGLANSGIVSVDSVNNTEKRSSEAQGTAGRSPREQAAGLIRNARRCGDRDRVAAMREAWQERIAICTIDSGMSADDAEEAALDQLKKCFT